MDYLRLEIDMNNRFGYGRLQERTTNKPSWQELYLDDDAEIEMDDYSPLWNTKDSTRSLPFKVSIKANAAIFGNSGNMRGKSVYDVLQNRPFRLWADGMVFMNGIVKLDKTINSKGGYVEIELHGTQKSFDQQLEGVKARDVEILGEKRERHTQIGWCLGDEIQCDISMKVSRRVQQVANPREVTIPNQTRITLPSTMVPFVNLGGSSVRWNDFTNDTNPYPKERYCNIKICSPLYVEQYDENGNPSSFDLVRGYHVADASRTHSSPCFYVMWWLEMLMQDLGIIVTRNDMYNEPDLLRLAFVHSSCKYAAGDGDKDILNDNLSWDEANKAFTLVANERLCLVLQSFVNSGNFWMCPIVGDNKMDAHFPGLEAQDFSSQSGRGHTLDTYSLAGTRPAPVLYRAYATSENFPDADAKDIIEAIRTGFNLRFLYDMNTNSLRIVFVEDILTQKTFEEIKCTIAEEYKTENEVRGFRLKYKSSNAINTNSITGEKKLTVGSEETMYNYYDFRNVELIENYQEIFNKIGPMNSTLYISKTTGDAFRIKVDKNAKGNDETLYPSMFEVLNFHDVEIGDCEDKDTTEEITIGFSPVMTNNVNFKAEYDAMTSGGDPSQAPSVEDMPKPNLCVYADCEIHSNSNGGQVSEKEAWKKTLWQDRSYLGMYSQDIITKAFACEIHLTQGSVDSYDPSQEHPYDGVDYGLTFGILREGAITGRGAFTADSVDNSGNILCEHSERNEITVNSGNVGSIIREYFPDSHVDLLDASLNASTSTLVAAGYDGFTGYNEDNYLLLDDEYTDHDGIRRKYLFTPCRNKGVVIPYSQITQYMAELESSAQSTNTSIMELDAKQRNVIIGCYDDWDTLHEYWDLLWNLGMVYLGGSDEIVIFAPNHSIPKPGLSLKLQAEKFNPDSKDKVNNTYNDYPYPISEECAKRGLYDKRYVNYAYFVMNRKISNLSFPNGGIETAVLRNIDYLKKYKIGERVGFINRIHYKIGKKTGLNNVSMEMYYI